MPIISFDYLVRKNACFLLLVFYLRCWQESSNCELEYVTARDLRKQFVPIMLDTIPEEQKRTKYLFGLIAG